MPEMKEIMERFPGREFLIDLKQADAQTAEILWSYLEELPEEERELYTFYGSEEAMAYLRSKRENAKVLTKKRLMKALIKYELLGWSGYIPDEIKNMELHIPLTYAGFLWGWPSKFTARMESVNSRVVIVEGNGKWSEGFDDIGMLDSIPKGFDGYVWTNRIDRISGKDKYQ